MSRWWLKNHAKKGTPCRSSFPGRHAVWLRMASTEDYFWFLQHAFICNKDRKHTLKNNPFKHILLRKKIIKNNFGMTLWTQKWFNVLVQLFQPIWGNYFWQLDTLINIERCVEPERVVNVLEGKEQTVVVVTLTVCGKCHGCLTRKVIYHSSKNGVCWLHDLLQTDSTTCSGSVPGWKNWFSAVGALNKKYSGWF